MMMLQFQRNGTNVTLDMPTALNQQYRFVLVFTPLVGDVLTSLAVEDLNARLCRAVKEARKEAYQQGWREAKAKRGKRDFFSGWLEIGPK